MKRVKHFLAAVLLGLFFAGPSRGGYFGIERRPGFEREVSRRHASGVALRD